MITQEHLEHWLNEIHYQLNGIRTEIAVPKLKEVKGMPIVPDPDNPTKTVFVSFEYLREKANTIAMLIGRIHDDIKEVSA